MKSLIQTPGKDPLGAMVLDCLAGDKSAFVSVESSDLEMWEMTGQTLLRSHAHMNRIEQTALSLCRGRTLDIGAGAGSHSLWLQDRGTRVEAIDISPGCVKAMKQRQVQCVSHMNLFSLEPAGPTPDQGYDTLLMLMNGIGIAGSLDGLNLFFQHAAGLLNPGGQILADSTDLGVLYTVNPDDPEYFGQTRFTMTYRPKNGQPVTGQAFDWLYCDPSTLAFYAGLHHFETLVLDTDSTGKFLARLRFTP